MRNRIVLDVESSKPLEQLGNGHIIAFDSHKRTYYAATREEFLAVQNAIIEQQNKIIKDLKRENEEYKNSLTNKVEEYILNNDKRMEEFIENFKINNAKLIEMVKEVVLKEDK